MKNLVYWLDVVAFLSFTGALWRYGDWSTRFLAGMSTAAVGFAFWMVARMQLGESFHPRARAKKLVTTGLYSRFRNPIYVFGQVAYLGLAIAWGRAAGFLWVAVTCLFQILRARNEQRVLEQAFGDEYRSYKAHTWF